MRVGPTCGAHPHMTGCCAVVVLVLYKNQIPLKNDRITHGAQHVYYTKTQWSGAHTLDPTPLCFGIVHLLCTVSARTTFLEYLGPTCKKKNQMIDH
jgi:hypothetical protein